MFSHNPLDDEQQDEPIYEPEDELRAAQPSPAEAAQLDQPEADSGVPHDPYAALRFRDYNLYSFGGLLAALGGQMFSVAVGWELFHRAPNARTGVWTLGLVGLIQAVPVVFLALPAGDMADRLDRRRILLWMELIIGCGWLSFVALSIARAPIWLYFVLLFLDATAGAVAGPARNALLPQLVPEEVLANAITWNSSRWQVASLLGPTVGGAVIALCHGVVAPVYAIAAVCAFALFFCVLPLRPRPHERPRESESAWQRLLVGLRFVRNQDIILATITLDLFAVFLGGAVTLLPAFADILHVGPAEFGWLRAAPAIGALGMSLWLSMRPPMQRAGRSLLWCVIGFGIATIVFGFSKNFYLSLFALAVTGALDNVSVVVRSTLVQVLTPPHMRGRVSAVNSVFIGSSNELGGFESGAAAKLLGTATSVVIGGIGTVAAVIGVNAIWPQIGKLGALDKIAPAAIEAEQAIAS